ncbi:MAG: nucleoside recognition domain-containing protein [Rhodospirillaceae bacterium]
MNAVFFALVATGFAVAAWRQLHWTPAGPGDVAPMQALTTGIIESAGGAVTLSIGLVGMMALFLGLVKVAEEGGLLRIIAKAIRPVMVRAFPAVPADHPAMGAMILNMAANVLGLGNAATPFGIRAMQELDKLNPHKGTATDAMVLFLAINTSSVTLLPTGVIALRAAAGSADPAGILPTTLFATLCSTATAIVAAIFLSRFFAARAADPDRPAAPTAAPEPVPGAGDLSAADEGYPLWVTVAAFVAIVAAIPLTVAYGSAVSPWIMPALIVAFLSFGVLRGVRVYEAFVEGARDGFAVAIRIIPYLVAILVAIAMLRASGALDALIGVLAPVTSLVGLPAEALPMALLRPLSGSGAYGVLASIINDPAIGPDSYVGRVVSTIQGSTETTFYVLAVYFGAVQIRRIRHALAAGLIADTAGILAAVAAVAWFYGG